MLRLSIAAGILLVAASTSSAVEFQQGLDVSHFQGAIDWNAVRDAGIKFTFAKATEGVDFVDANFHSYMAGAIAAGVPIGPYHFARLNSGETIPTDAIDEANDFVDAIQQYYNGPAMVLRPVLDYEQLPNDPVSPSVKAYVSKWIRDFSGVVEQRLGMSPIIYTCCGFHTSTFLEADIAQHDLWIRDITGGNTFDPDSPPQASDLGIWSDWKFWQWSATGNVAGISPVDRDAFEGSMEELAQFIPTYHAGDFDGSGTVDAADYVFWRKALGQSVHLGTGADGNLNGTVDSDDFRVWQANFGAVYAAGLGAAVSSVGVVPEADGCVLALFAIFGATAVYRRDRFGRVALLQEPAGSPGY
ncbi:MAG TPA: GH25 family lysozyme [Lacipirellulaceae bacterium]|nr:GH25 family lysozyme [Lacipirellulaceae bacterium]